METSINQSSCIWADFLNNPFIKYLLSNVEKGMATTLVLLPGEFHGQKSLTSYRTWGHGESDTAVTATH